MRLKRVYAIVLAGAVMLSMAGCGKSAEDNGQTATPAAVVTEKAATVDVQNATTLKDAFANDFKVGVAVSSGDMMDDDIVKLIKKNFNSITMGNSMKPESLLDQKSSEESADGMPGINEDELDRALSSAKDNGLALRGHCLVWHSQTPNWFFCEKYEARNPKVDKATMSKRMESYIKQVLTYCQDNYPGVVYAWDVVNEACDDMGGLREESNWYEIYGDDSYIIDAFTFARKYAADGVKLFYNDYNEYMPSKTETISELLQKLNEKKLVDGMGFQSHWTMDYPGANLITDAIEEYSKIKGLEIQFTEVDMHNTDDSKESLQRQAERYKLIFEEILKAKRSGKANITSVTFWGISDADTWLSGLYGVDSFPLLFDENYKKKPCYDSLMEAAKANY